VLTAALSAATALSLPLAARAADHRDSPTFGYDAAADISDVYFFKDTFDSSRVVLIGTTHGFIVPGEATNEAIFDPVIRYRFEIYNKHVNATRPAPVDPAKPTAAEKAALTRYLATIKPDKFIDVTFTPRVAAADPMAAVGEAALQRQLPQLAKIQLTGFEGISSRAVFSAPVLDPSLAGTAPDQQQAVRDLGNVVVAPATPANPGAAGIKVFFGETDDPFFFDIPAFGAFIGSIRAGGPAAANTAVFDRARDTFAGYNVMTIAFSLPINLLTKVKTGATFTSAGPVIGVDFLTQRHTVQMPGAAGDVRGLGAIKTVDRMGNPGVNVVLVPFNRKNSYNVGTPKDDATLKFALPTKATTKIPSEPGILDVLTALGTQGSPFDGLGGSSVGTLAALAVLRGDVLTLDTTAGVPAGFPNGRQLTDDVVDTLISVVTNGGYTAGDKVGANDVAFGTIFPYIAPSNQPLPNGAIDATKN
jgi:hypothetical protein